MEETDKQDWDDYEHPDFDERARRERFKRLFPSSRKVGPTRAMIATGPYGETATATFERWEDGSWHCLTASKHLRFLKGLSDSEAIKSKLSERGFKWRWIRGGFGKPAVRQEVQPSLDGV